MAGLGEWRIFCGLLGGGGVELVDELANDGIVKEVLGGWVDFV